MKTKITIVLVLFSGIIFFVKAQENNIGEATEDIIQNTYSVPTIPALEVVALDPSNISRPATAKEFVASIYNGIDANGKIKQGLGFEVKPNYIFNEPVTLQEYQNDRFRYILENTQLSIATLATSGDSTSTDLSWGIRLVLFDKTDPMQDSVFTNKVTNAFLKCAPIGPGESDEEKELKCLAEPVKEYKEEFIQENWNASWLMLAYAGGIRLSGSELTQGEIIGHKIWLAGGLRMAHWGQLGCQAQWSRSLKEESNIYFSELGISSRVTVKLGKPTINYFAEATFKPLLNKDEFDDQPEVNTDASFAWSSGFEFKVARGIWATTGLGRDAERIVGNNNIQLLSGFRLGISDKQRLK